MNLGYTRLIYSDVHSVGLLLVRALNVPQGSFTLQYNADVIIKRIINVKSFNSSSPNLTFTTLELPTYTQIQKEEKKEVVMMMMMMNLRSLQLIKTCNHLRNTSYTFRSFSLLPN